MKKSLSILIALLLGAAIAAPLAAVSLGSGGSSGEAIFESEGMRGVPTEFLAATGVTIRGVAGPGAPWVIDEGEVRIDADGRLRVEVDGLVIDPAHGPPLGGINPAPAFRVIVSCIDGTDGMGNPTFAEVITDPFPADEEGDASLDTMISLPDPCFAIVVFVTHPVLHAWFAVTGA